MMMALILGGLALAEEERFEMREAGTSFALPKGWTVPRWSDWDLDALGSDDAVQVQVRADGWQVPISPDAARAWAESTIDWLKGQGHDNAAVIRAVPVGDHAEIELKYSYKGKSPAILYQRSFLTEGRVVHIVSTALRSNARLAEQGLATWTGVLQITKPPVSLEDLGGPVESKVGFKAVLPVGWRQALGREKEGMLAMVAAGGQAKLEGCWIGALPYAGGDAGLLYACPFEWYGGQMAEDSVADIDPGFRAALFKTVAEKIPPATGIAAVNGTVAGLRYALPEKDGRTQILAATPYVKGYVLTWVTGPASQSEALSAALAATLESTVLPEGSHPVAIEDRIAYAARHRPLLLAGPGLGLLALLAGVIVFIRKATSHASD